MSTFFYSFLSKIKIFNIISLTLRSYGHRKIRNFILQCWSGDTNESKTVFYWIKMQDTKSAFHPIFKIILSFSIWIIIYPFHKQFMSWNWNIMKIDLF